MPKRFPTADPQIVMYEDGTYYVRVGDRERSLKTKDWKLALKRKPAALALIDAGGDGSAHLRFVNVFDPYAACRKAQIETRTAQSSGKAQRGRKTISAGTYAEILNLWRLHLGPFWSQVRLDKADELKWAEYCEQSTIIDLANHRKVFLGVLKWCKLQRYIKYVPELTVPPVERRERRVLKPAEIRKLFEHAEGNVLLFISMYLFMGMRRKEIMTLRWENVHFLEGYLVLKKGDVKTRRGRPLPINPFVLAILAKRREGQLKRGSKTAFVFPNRESAARPADVSGLKTAWRTILAKCKFESGYVTPHDLRATYEAYAHKATAFTDTQREKFAGSAIDVQKKTYVRFDADDVRGLESVVTVEGLDKILERKIMGKQRGEQDEKSLH